MMISSSWSKHGTFASGFFLQTDSHSSQRRPFRLHLPSNQAVTMLRIGPIPIGYRHEVPPSAHIVAPCEGWLKLPLGVSKSSTVCIARRYDLSLLVLYLDECGEERGLTTEEVRWLVLQRPWSPMKRLEDGCCCAGGGTTSIGSDQGVAVSLVCLAGAGHHGLAVWVVGTARVKVEAGVEALLLLEHAVEAGHTLLAVLVGEARSCLGRQSEAVLHLLQGKLAREALARLKLEASLGTAEILALKRLQKAQKAG